MQISTGRTTRLLQLLLWALLSSPIDELLDGKLSDVGDLCLQDQLSHHRQLVFTGYKRDFVLGVLVAR